MSDRKTSVETEEQTSSEATPQPRSEEFKQFKEVLYEIFQFDVADLDFGIYRILNEKREAIDRFIKEDLHDTVQDGISSYVEKRAENLKDDAEAAANRVRKQVADDAIIGEGIGELNDEYADVEIKVAREAIEEYQTAKATYENAEMAKTTERRVYDDLAKFFRRFYDEGDFITQRRFKAGDSKYVVPYDGEEVLLHWANRDQYYVKTSEHFKNYRFDAQDYEVEFELVDAETPQDNAKDNESRYFVLHGDDPVSVDSEAQTCTITIAYRAITEDEKDAIVERYNDETGESKSRLKRRMLCTALEARILDLIDNTRLEGLLKEPKDEGDDHGRLYSHLNRYTAKNTADYFVHKDLEGFLSGQLENFIQNEVLDLDDVLDSRDESVLERAVDRAKVVKTVGEQVIAFLAQIEDFQKRLFEKKKFIVDTGYCITLDHVPEPLYDAILNNEDQLNEWREVYSLDEAQDGLFGQGYHEGTFERDFLETHPRVMVDTRHFSQDFTDRLIGHLSTQMEGGIDDQVEGLCIQGENLQALSLLKPSLNGKPDSAYFDPPYNTGKDDFLYKDSYRHSSWLTMMQDRLGVTREILPEKGVMSVSVDDNEVSKLKIQLQELSDHLGTLVIQTATDNNPTQINTEHEYITVFAKDKSEQGKWFGPSKEAEKIIDKYNEIKSEIGNNPEEIQNRLRSWINDNEEGLSGATHYDNVDEKGVFHDGDIANTKFGGPKYEILHPDTGKPVKIPDKGFRYTEETMIDMIENDNILFGEDETILPKPKVRIENKTDALRSVIYEDGRTSTKELESMFYRDVFKNPKSKNILSRLFTFTSEESGTILDCFAGSGTSGHAVMHLNREREKSQRKYVLIELGRHFDEVMIPRLKKVAFSDSWSDGRPTGGNGMSHFIKYHRIESYEDTLNNVEIKEPSGVTQSLFREWGDYEMRYMLNEETSESETLLQPGAFEAPFDYTLRIQHGMESPKQHKVDLEATFNYLIGLQVNSRRVYYHENDDNRRYVIVTGTVESDEGTKETMVIWRNIEGLNDDTMRREKAWFESEIIGDRTFDTIYVNGTSFIDGAEPLDVTFRERMDPAQ